MKKRFVRMSESDRKAFLDFCEATKNHEADKDTFLKAARLERHESKREPLKAKDIMKIVGMGGVFLTGIAVMAFGYLANKDAFPIAALIAMGVMLMGSLIIGMVMDD